MKVTLCARLYQLNLQLRNASGKGGQSRVKNSFLACHVRVEKKKVPIKHDLNMWLMMKVNLFQSKIIANNLNVLFPTFDHSQAIVVILIINTCESVRVDMKNEATAATGEISDLPKAEALTLVVHKFPQSPQLRPVKLIDRNDDVVVIHSNRSKRRPSTRKRRPSSSQYRSKIKNLPGSSSNFGGFKDFTSTDFRGGSSSDYRPNTSSRFPTFPTKHFGEPPRASNKYKFGSNPYEGYSYNPPKVKKSKRPSVSKPKPIYGPPPSFNQYESTFNKEPAQSSHFDGKPLQTLQQQQSSFPSYSVDTVESSGSNYYGGGSDQYPQPISNFPLDSGSSYNIPQTSYGSPVQPQTYSNFNYNPNLLATNLNSNSNKNSNPNSNPSQSSNSNFPKLPNRYEPKDFSTPTRTNPLNGNSFSNPEYQNFNDVAETQNVHTALNDNRQRFKNFNKFNNFDYDFKGGSSSVQANSSPSDEGYDSDDESDNLDYLFSTRRPNFRATTTTTTTTEAPSTTKRPKKGSYGKRKRPGKISQSHTLDTQDLREAYTESSDFHEVALSSDDFTNFDSQRHNKRNHVPQFPHEIHATLKSARKQSSALRTALGDDFQIVSIEKSLEKNPSDVNFGFQRKNDHILIGSELKFGSAAEASSIWNGDFENFPRNHRFS